MWVSDKPGLEGSKGVAPHPLYRGVFSRFLDTELRRMLRIEGRKTFFTGERDGEWLELQRNRPFGKRHEVARLPIYSPLQGIINTQELYENNSLWPKDNPHLYETNSIAVKGEPLSILGPNLLTEKYKQDLLKSVIIGPTERES